MLWLAKRIYSFLSKDKAGDIFVVCLHVIQYSEITGWWVSNKFASIEAQHFKIEKKDIKDKFHIVKSYKVVQLVKMCLVYLL